MRAGDVNVGVGFFGAAKQQACFGGGELGQDLGAANKGVRQMLEAVGAHHRIHHFGFDRERDVHLVVLGHRFPVLVTQGVAQLEAGFDQYVQGLFFQLLEVNHHHVAQVQLHHHGGARWFIPHQYIAIGQHYVAFQRNPQIEPADTGAPAAAFLRFTLVKHQQVDVGAFQFLFPDRVFLGIAQNVFNQNHVANSFLDCYGPHPAGAGPGDTDSTAWSASPGRLPQSQPKK